jgi:hypothetical protein
MIFISLQILQTTVRDESLTVHLLILVLGFPPWSLINLSVDSKAINDTNTNMQNLKMDRLIRFFLVKLR